MKISLDHKRSVGGDGAIGIPSKKPEIASLKMGPFYGTFMGFGILMGLAMLAFLGELVKGRGRPKRKI